MEPGQGGLAGGGRGLQELNKDLLDNLFLIEMALLHRPGSRTGGRQVVHNDLNAMSRARRAATSARRTSRTEDATMGAYLLRRLPSALVVLPSRRS